MFVFVVCGAREHIETLHFSLNALHRYSKNKIIVLTDSSRNEIQVEWKNVIDVKTPEQFNHHQASIFIKTSLHRLLPKGNTYCYLDTDVIALDRKVDDIFKYKEGIVTFAQDHCTMPKFSPHAVHCDCVALNKTKIDELEFLMEKYNPIPYRHDPVMVKKRNELLQKFETLKKDKLNYFFISLRFLATFRKFKLDDDSYYDRWKRAWMDKEGRIIFPKVETKSMIRDMEKNTPWRWNAKRNRWIGPDGSDVYDLQCYHLAEYINDKFGIEVKEKSFQHWNGGVFLFDDSSHPFLDSWHEKTMAIFDDPNWKTRDQGTLIATAWEFGLQNNPLLPVEYNFIADYNHPTMIYHGELTFDIDEKVKAIKPHFIHIYHNWGDTTWEVWNDVFSFLSKEYA